MDLFGDSILKVFSPKRLFSHPLVYCVYLIQSYRFKYFFYIFLSSGQGSISMLDTIALDSTTAKRPQK